MSYRQYDQLSQEAQAIGINPNQPSYSYVPQQSSYKKTSFSASTQKKA